MLTVMSCRRVRLAVLGMRCVGVVMMVVMRSLGRHHVICVVDHRGLVVVVVVRGRVLLAGRVDGRRRVVLTRVLVLVLRRALH